MKNYLLIIKISVAALFANKVRAFLTMLGIMIGTSSVIAIMSIGAGAQSLITNSIQSIGTNLIGILPGVRTDNAPPPSAMGIVITTLKRADSDAIVKLEHVVAVAPYSRGNGEIVSNYRAISGDFTGTTPDLVSVEGHKLADGRFFSKQEETSSGRVAVLGADMKDELFPNRDPVGERLKINGISFKIIGVLERKGSMFVFNPDNQVYIPLSTAQHTILGIDYLGLIRLRVDKEEYVDLVQKRIKSLLKYRHRIEKEKDEDFTVSTLIKALDVFTSVTDALRFFLVAIAAISLLVGGIGVTNIMYMTINERKREIGLRKAIGAKVSQIKNQFILEAVVITIIGGVFGIILGIVGSYLISLMVNYAGYNWSFVVTIESVLISFFVSIFIGIFFGTFPAKKASKLNPIESLRFE